MNPAKDLRKDESRYECRPESMLIMNGNEQGRRDDDAEED